MTAPDRPTRRRTVPSRIIVIAGIAAMLIGAVDPLEGSLVIVPGSGLVALGARLGKSRHRKSLYWSFALVAAGVGALWGLSAIGGLGGPGGHPYWWGLVGGVRELREASRISAAR